MDCQWRQAMKNIKLIYAAMALSMLNGCQVINSAIEGSDNYLALKIDGWPDKDVCWGLKQNYGHQTMAALKIQKSIRRIDCGVIKATKKIEETPEQREKRINEAIQLLNSAAQISSPTYNQHSTPGIGSICHLAGQSRSGLYKNCAYNCASGTVYRAMSSTDICPISVNQ